MDYLAEIDEELSNELGDSMTYRNKSPFGRHFDSILQKSNSFVQNLQTRSQNVCLEENSRYYLPNLPESVDFGFNDIGFSDKSQITTHFSCPEVRSSINIPLNLATYRI